jgi:cysteine/O-acetylserine efflux protein
MVASMNLFAFISYVVTTTFTPGPNNLMAMSNGLHTGFKRTARFLGGIFVGFILIMLICGFVNFVLMSTLPALRPWLNLLGAGYMLYLAFHVMTSKPHEEELNESLNTFKAGLSMQFINPKVILYGITVFSNFIIPNYRNPMAVILFSLLLATVGLIASTSWATFGVVFRTFFSQYARIINIIMGFLLIYSAIASLGFRH